MDFFQQSRQYLGQLPLELVRLSIWLLLLIALFVPLERKYGVRAGRLFRRGIKTDLAYYFLSSIFPKLLLSIPLGILAAGAHHFIPSAYYDWTATLPLAVRVAASLVVAETGTYWAHRWSHESPFLWRFHAIHHSAEEVDWLVNSRAHPVDLLFTRLCGLIPLYLLGLAQPASGSVDLAPLLVTILGTLWGFFIHANLKWRFGWLEYLIASPAFHHWHHNNEAPELINKNYAAMFPLADLVFGSFYLPADRLPQRYGTDTDVGAELSEQLLRPFGGQKRID